MKKFISEIPTNLFEIFLVELNGYGAEIISKDENITIFAIYSEDKDAENIKETILSIFEDLGSGKIIVEEDIQEEDWSEKWKENFKPIYIKPFLIIPEWEIAEPKENQIPIKLKIAMAFGTGLHPTTQLMLSFLPKYIKPEYTVMDIGTGTGILAIASAKLGAKKIDAIDIEKEAIEECKINAWENQVNINCYQGSIEDIKEKYDIVLANLQIEIFEKYFDNIAKLFNKYLIISGIFNNKEAEKIKDFVKKNNLKIIEEKKAEDLSNKEDFWYAFAIRNS
ncbi:50S ribosomal protein L11 methyltransferase [Venenivibrio stagnispumantis]|uniref:Ribosomal protein L11 methyltransferase n=1 Tax=Venenivibrio stagnispumantis TaxID=407998 RepID=A0AA45WL73_9AQUI|nr:50S ribosomal protein L11 methyltransferase [Venenivibrio stagnispumantis]MCW4573838.1 50S ribosomal protein L11 methyltransferase [Venenivibrio stagnispumantis]SMP10208.1 [LSU ribosomal protein L11P]-lysine N-methyltransferase [Venenivibrio stagnispumantis]